MIHHDGYSGQLSVDAKSSEQADRDRCEGSKRIRGKSKRTVVEVGEREACIGEDVARNEG
jgi:hypothetical protein